MHNYRISCSWTMFGHFWVEAESKAEAIRIAKEQADDMPLPDNGVYLDNSFQIDEEYTEEY